jgi:glutamine synthetase
VGISCARPKDTLTGYRDRLSELLMGMGYRIRYHHHEVGRRQQEIETGYYPALEAADYLLLFKYLAKYLGVNSGLLPTFMPKPSSHDAGNGMHFHFFLRKGARNAFNSGGRMSKLAMSFVAGLLEHAPGLCAFTNPTVNSYRRLLPDFEAPVVIGWSRSNRSALIRVPASAKEEKTNVEIRSPDPSADPYFASTAMLAAGLDGIGRKLSPPEEGKGNLYESGDVRLLPKSLEEALEYAGDDEVLVKAVGEGTFELYRKAKLEEVESHRRQVPVWDFNMYYGV